MKYKDVFLRALKQEIYKEGFDAVKPPIDSNSVTRPSSTNSTNSDEMDDEITKKVGNAAIDELDSEEITELLQQGSGLDPDIVKMAIEILQRRNDNA